MDGESAPLPTPRKRSPTHYPILCMSLSTVWSFSELQNELTVDLVSVDLVCKLVSQSPIRSMHQQGDQMHSDYCRGLLHSQGLAGARRGSQGLAGARRGSQGLAGEREFPTIREMISYNVGNDWLVFVDFCRGTGV
jgi:hypothetical protein